MKRRKKRSLDPVEHFQRTCGWCGKRIPPDTEVFGGGIKARPGVDLSQQAGQVLAMYVAAANKTVLVAVTGQDSDARKDGYDLMYMTCSAQCGQQLRAAFQADIDLGNQLRSP